MELDDLKNLWKEENKKLEGRIELNEKRLIQTNMDKAVGPFDKLIRISIWGRNLALVYCAISIVVASQMMEKIAYSIPAIVGGLAMLWSFVAHLAIDKPDYHRTSIIDLQKSIHTFRVHTSFYAKYDIAVVLLWLLTLAPPYLKLVYNADIYTNTTYLAVFCLVSFVIIVLIIALSVKTYKKQEVQLKQSESYLQEVMEFEKT